MRGHECRLLRGLLLTVLIVCSGSWRADAAPNTEGEAKSAALPFLEGVPKGAEQDKPLPVPASHDFSGLAGLVSPAVVNISGEGAAEELTKEAEGLPFDNGDQPRSLGSGFILNTDGYIVTNNHVVDKAKRVIVRLLDDRREYQAKVIGVDPKTDIALLKIDSVSKLTPVYLGDSDAVKVGEWVMAIGNQFQLGQTVTAGIVSAKARRVPSALAGPYDNFIQTDASINPGSSGGPLINSQGQVIGVNTAIFSPGRSQLGGTGFNIGIGFATPINQVKQVVTQLMEKGRVSRGLLGVVIQPVTKEVAEALALTEPIGALVGDIMKGSPAEKAGFRRGDVIVRYGPRQIESHDELPLLVANTELNAEVPVDVIRDGRTKTIKAVITELTETAVEDEPTPPKPDTIGLAVEEVTPEMARSFGIGGLPGVLVVHVEPRSPAALAGFSRGDIIEELGGVPVRKISDYDRARELRKKNAPVLALVRRRKGTRYLVIPGR